MKRQRKKMGDVFHDHVKLNPDWHYFIYVGEIKAFHLYEFFQEALSRLWACPVGYIAIVPDVLETYPDGNIVAINPNAARAAAEAGRKVSCRMPGRDFAACVSTHPRVLELIRELQVNQKEVPIAQFQSLPEMTLDRLPGVRVVGPDREVANAWNSKLNMYDWLQGQVPLPEHRICRSRKELMEAAGALWTEWSHGIFVTLEYSAAGAFSFVARSHQEMLDKLSDWRPPYLIARFIPHTLDPTVLSVVANSTDVYIGGIADQQMESVNKFRGSAYPSVLTGQELELLKEYTRRVGRAMGARGYRGIFGCDFILSEDGRFYFVEVNARKQGTTMEMCCNLENSLPAGSPNLLELEYHALTRGAFPEGVRELEGNPAGIHWGTYNYKLERDEVTVRALQGAEPERDLFRRIADDGPDRAGHIVVEHIGPDHLVKAGTFLGRVVAVARDHAGVNEELEKGRTALKATLAPR